MDVTAFLAMVSIAAAGAPGPATAPTGSKEVAPMTLNSPAFKAGGAIPSRYTCDGSNTSPALAWTGAPAGTKSLTLVVTDPDAPDPKAPKMTWVHWVLYDLPADAASLREAVGPDGLPPGTREGTNDWGKTGYGGPCPPIGKHRYFFVLSALDTVLPDLSEPSRAALEKSMEDHVLARAELIGTYQRQ